MSDNENRDLFDQEHSAQSALLDELDSLKDLLDEEATDSPTMPATVNEIRSVKQYMELKEQADKAGLSLDAYLEKYAAAEEEAITLDDGIEEDEENIPTLDEVVPYDIGEIDDGIEIPTLEEAVEIPTLEETVEASPAPSTGGYSLEEIERIVDHVVRQRLEAIRPQLEKQVFDEIRNMLPVNLFK